jgi:hypothetical protein
VTVVELNKLLEPRTAHVERFRDFLLYLKALTPSVWPQSPEELRAIAQNDTKARERCLYVEVAPDGAPKVPPR